MKRLLIILLTTVAFLNCKKKEVRQLIKSIEGNYIVYQKSTSSFDNTSQLIFVYDTIETEIKKSTKGFKFSNIYSDNHFILNEADSSFEMKEKDEQISSFGKIQLDSIYLDITTSNKLPFGTEYKMFPK